jgi:hypothetical protein
MNPFDALNGLGRRVMWIVAVLVVLAFAAGKASAATCSVAEFAERPPVTYQAAFAPALATSVVTYTTSSVQSVVFQQTTALVRVSCDATAYIVFGANPTATLTNLRLAANQVEYFAITPASAPPYVSLRLAVIGP